MQPGTVAMVLAAAAAHATWNLASKYKRGDALLFVCAYTYASTLLCVPIGIAFAATGRQTGSSRRARRSRPCCTPPIP
jgi:hypothetical protein